MESRRVFSWLKWKKLELGRFDLDWYSLCSFWPLLWLLYCLGPWLDFSRTRILLNQPTGNFGGSLTLPETNRQFPPENGWVRILLSFLGSPIFRGKLAVSFREKTPCNPSFLRRRRENPLWKGESDTWILTRPAFCRALFHQKPSDLGAEGLEERCGDVRWPFQDSWFPIFVYPFFLNGICWVVPPPSNSGNEGL